MVDGDNYLLVFYSDLCVIPIRRNINLFFNIPTNNQTIQNRQSTTDVSVCLTMPIFQLMFSV